MAESISGLPSLVIPKLPQVAVGNTPVLIKAGKGNLYGYIAENEGGSAVWLHFFDEAAALDVTLGVSVPVFTHSITAGGKFGRDPVNLPLDHFERGVVVAVTTTRAGIADPGFSIYLKSWYRAQP